MKRHMLVLLLAPIMLVALGMTYSGEVRLFASGSAITDLDLDPELDLDLQLDSAEAWCWYLGSDDHTAHCPPCPPDEYTCHTDHPHYPCTVKKQGSDAHTHVLTYNQRPSDCECFPRRDLAHCGC